MQIQIEMEVQNRAVDVCALSVCGSLGTHADASTLAIAPFQASDNGQPKTCHMLQPDFIRSQAQVTAFYQKVVLATTETSASVNAMNYPLSSAERLLSAAGSRF